jgi:hypothetical protein
VVAKREGASPVAAQLVVGDLNVVPPRRTWGTSEDYENLGDQGKQWLKESGVQVSMSRRLKFAGGDAIEVRGLGKNLENSIRLFYRGRRLFQVRCFASPSLGVWPCESAFASFEVGDTPEEHTASKTPYIPHLRDARYGIVFDAPDDSWLAATSPGTPGGATSQSQSRYVRFERNP